MRTLLISAVCVMLALAGTAQANMITYNGSTVFNDTFENQTVGVPPSTANISPGPGEWSYLLSGANLGVKIETIDNPSGPGAFEGTKYLYMERPSDGGAAVSRGIGTAFNTGNVHAEMMVYQFVNLGNNFGSVHFNAGSNDGENTGGGGALFQAVSFPDNKIWMMDVDGDWGGGHLLQKAGGGDLLWAAEQWQKWEFDIDLDADTLVITVDGVQSATEDFVADVPLQFLNTRMNGGGAGGTNGSRAYIDAVPEPGTLALLVSGLIGLMAYGWRKRR